MLPPYVVPDEATWLEPATATDDYGNEVPDWDGATENTIRVWIEEASTTEQRDGRDTITSRWLLLTNELGITAHARIVHNDRTFEIDGEPSILRTPSGPHHLEATLLLVEG